MFKYVVENDSFLLKTGEFFSTIEFCPYCGEKLSAKKLIPKLDKEIEEFKKKKTKEYKRDINDLDKEIEELKKQLGELNE